MIYQGHVENGRIVLDDEASLPDGARVTVNVVATSQVPKPSEDKHATHSEKPPTLYEQFQGIIGITDDLPEDMSVQHDHYLYGTPKEP